MYNKNRELWHKKKKYNIHQKETGKKKKKKSKSDAASNLNYITFYENRNKAGIEAGKRAKTKLTLTASRNNKRQSKTQF